MREVEGESESVREREGVLLYLPGLQKMQT